MPMHPLNHPKMLTTGVLNTVVGQTAAHIEVVNLGALRAANVTVQVFNWNSGNPVLLLNQSVTIQPNTFLTFSQAVEPFHYEIRLTLPAHSNVVANTFAINADTSTLPGLTLTEKDMKHLH